MEYLIWRFVKGDSLKQKLGLIMLDFVLESVLVVVLVLDLAVGNRGGIEMATTVRITETYDMKTTVNKMGIIGIHTPSDAQVRNLYPGLMRNHRFIRFLKCDVVGACASVLPADPLSVGVGSGQVAPEDMFNPILYKAVTNESFDTLVNRIYGGSHPGALGSVSVDEPTHSAPFEIYYSLLAENGKYRKAMPQQGFAIKNLVPICHTLISTYGNLHSIGNFLGEEITGDDTRDEHWMPELTNVNETAANLGSTSEVGDAVVFRGRPVRMPKIPLHYDLEPISGVPQSVNIPETFVACLIIPPAKLHEFYYRMRVSWTIRFEEVCSTIEQASGNGMSSVGNLSYYKSYSYTKSEADLPEKTDTVDADNVSINKIMES